MGGGGDGVVKGGVKDDDVGIRPRRHHALARVDVVHLGGRSAGDAHKVGGRQLPAVHQLLPHHVQPLLHAREPGKRKSGTRGRIVVCARAKEAQCRDMMNGRATNRCSVGPRGPCLPALALPPVALTSSPLTPLGMMRKSWRPTAFWLLLNTAWSVPTSCSTPPASAARSAAPCSLWQGWLGATVQCSPTIPLTMVLG